MKKYIFLPFIFIILLFPKDILAQDDFTVDANVTYHIGESGRAKVTYEITIENNNTEVYAKDFQLVLSGTRPEDVSALEDGIEQQVAQSEKEGKTYLDVNFDSAIVGKGQKRKFEIMFIENTIAKRLGEVWEISVPKLEDTGTFSSYNTNLVIPDSFGNEAYLSPSPFLVNDLKGFSLYNFKKDQVTKNGISAGFGEFQIYTFDISYHLENKNKTKSTLSVAFPSDTSTQTVSLDQVSPEPKEVDLDLDGNWLAFYELEGEQRIDVNVKGRFEVFGRSEPHLIVKEETLEKSLMATKYWPSDNPEVVRLAKELETPHNIYRFVINTLTYDNNRAKPDVERLGGLTALNNPDSAICMEFTDLFVTLSRAADIPAREINGFAYSENPDIEPLGLVADVLHSWPQYWDDKAKTWISVDPTWEHTTKGVDYFNKLDLKHIAFVIHGVDDTRPYPPGSYKLGDNPQKDVFVNLGQQPLIEENDISISAKRISTIPFLPGEVRITIKNNGPKAEYGLKPKVSYNETTIAQRFIEVIPPFGVYEFDVEIPYSFLGTNTPNYLLLTTGKESLEVSTHKLVHVAINLVVSSSAIIFLIIVILVKARRIKLKNN